MKYGLEIPNGGQCAAPLILGEFAHLAEQAGWDGIFLEDYICYYGGPAVPTYDPWVTLAVMAMRTQHIRLGTTVTAVARRRPWKLARELVTLDHLSNGRMILGVGLGDDLDFSRFGETPDPKLRAELLDEGLEILAGLWSGQPFSYSGEHYSIGEVIFQPQPVQKPRIPIWVGGSSRKKGPMRRAARWDGVVPTPIEGRHLTPEEVQALKELILSYRVASTPFDIAVGGLERSDDWEADRALIGSLPEAGVTWWMEQVVAESYDVMRAAIERGPLRI